MVSGANIVHWCTLYAVHGVYYTLVYIVHWCALYISVRCTLYISALWVLEAMFFLKQGRAGKVSHETRPFRRLLAHSF